MKMSCFVIVRKCFFVLTIFVVPRVVFSNVLNKCKNLDRFKDSELEDYSANYVIVPALLMSNYQETNFR